MTTNSSQNGSIEKPKEISTFRRVFPQFYVSIIQNLMELHKSIYQGMPSIVIPSLRGFSHKLNPNETVRITGKQSSWLRKFNISKG